MPKIKITEIDNTGIIQSSAISNTVYMPGKSLSTENALAPKLFTSLSELKGYNYGTGTSPLHYDTDNLSYKLMCHLLELGVYVLYEGIKESTVGQCPEIDWVRLQDKGNYDIRFLTLGGYFETQSGMLSCAANRGDCVALLSHPSTLNSLYSLLSSEPSDWTSAWTTKYKGNVATRTPQYSSLDSYVPFISGLYYKNNASVYEVLIDKPSNWNQAEWGAVTYYKRTWQYTPKQDASAPTFALNTYFMPTTSQVSSVRAYFENFKSSVDASYSAAFTPNFKTTLNVLGGSQESPVTIPATFGYLFAYAKAIQSNPEWYAVAGSQRGKISELSSVEYEYSSSEIEILQGRARTGEVALDDENDNVGCAINPIAYVRPFGHIVWGNRTFKENDATTKTTAASFLNVRNGVSAVKKSLYNAARKYTYEQNGDILWINFKSQVTPLLDKMQSGNGILGYKFIKLKTNAKARLKARLVLIPIEAVEDFELEVELNDSLEVTE